ncbi:MAG: tellurite resistance TerB family protein [Methyloligellaceae bacterium]
MSDTISHHEALIYVMVIMSAVDGSMSDEELVRIGNIVKHVPVFRDFEDEKLVGVAEACATLSGRENSLQEILNLVAISLPEKLYETAYALAVEIAAADLEIVQEELRLLELLRDKLGLDKLTIAAIERGARARHQVL